MQFILRIAEQSNLKLFYTLSMDVAVCAVCLSCALFRLWYESESESVATCFFSTLETKQRYFAHVCVPARPDIIYSSSSAVLHRFDVALPKYYFLLLSELNHFVSSEEKFVMHEGRTRRAAWYFVLTLSEGCPFSFPRELLPRKLWRTWEPLLKSNFSETLAADYVRRQRLRR